MVEGPVFLHREYKVKVSRFGIKQEAAGVFTENVVSPYFLLLYQTSSIFVTSAAWSGFRAVVGGALISPAAAGSTQDLGRRPLWYTFNSRRREGTLASSEHSTAISLSLVLLLLPLFSSPA